MKLAALKFTYFPTTSNYKNNVNWWCTWIFLWIGFAKELEAQKKSSVFPCKHCFSFINPLSAVILEPSSWQLQLRFDTWLASCCFVVSNYMACSIMTFQKWYFNRVTLNYQRVLIILNLPIWITITESCFISVTADIIEPYWSSSRTITSWWNRTQRPSTTIIDKNASERGRPYTGGGSSSKFDLVKVLKDDISVHR